MKTTYYRTPLGTVYGGKTINVTPYLIGGIVALVALVTLPFTVDNIQQANTLRAQLQPHTVIHNVTLEGSLLQPADIDWSAQPQGESTPQVTTSVYTLQPQAIGGGQGLHAQSATPLQNAYTNATQ
jgi:hypothetical protein